jgi:hypothetical protein
VWLLVADGGESIELESATKAARHAGISLFGYSFGVDENVALAKVQPRPLVMMESVFSGTALIWPMIFWPWMPSI